MGAAGSQKKQPHASCHQLWAHLQHCVFQKKVFRLLGCLASGIHLGFGLVPRDVTSWTRTPKVAIAVSRAQLLKPSCSNGSLWVSVATEPANAIQSAPRRRKVFSPLSALVQNQRKTIHTCCDVMNRTGTSMRHSRRSAYAST